jgi:2-dehydro-3-deoxyphosphogluconate aldolase/(4S)-4-hydroxy-2-oxoglutarate aldolase
MSADMISLLTRARVLPVLTIQDASRAAPLACALSAGGLSVLEITLRTPEALDAIRAIAQNVPDVIVGAGTVLNKRDAEAARGAGARFAVSPGMTPLLLTHQPPLPWLAGVASASDIMAGLEAGLTVFKFFPAESAGGPAALKALSGPFPDVRFCPTGGINTGNIGSYRSLSNVICVGGSWMVDQRAIDAERWDDITNAARAAAAL